ncbi:MAG: HD domain-containing protein [Parcubacteria group bacterium]|nr:HD domain-containing protein [Parcubacteria group bacterium]MCR4342840.1 HD domain-containing protein [Patescibacteria group bacterium]
MLYEDKIYGEVEIDEPVILEIINSPDFQRLKGVDQAGYFKPHIKRNKVTRFEHSVGVYILLKKFGAPLEEQIAGLIHDISHSAFSHCIDYVLDEGSEKDHDHQDNIFEDFIKNKTQIPSILNKHGFDVDYIIDDKNFPLKERDLPDLCADRIDYSLRDGRASELIDDDSIKLFLDKLKTEDGKWYFDDFETAKKFAKYFMDMNDKYWTGIHTAVMFRCGGDFLKHGLSKRYITIEDLYKTDNYVLDKLRFYTSKDDELKRLFDRADFKINITNSPSGYDAKLLVKSRAVNPLFREDKEFLRVSDLDKEWVEILKRESNPKEWFLKFDD